MSILGITIDYGPYGFQEYFDWDHVPNGSDGTGRYDYKSQPEICKWNVMKLAESCGFCGVLDVEAGKAVVEEEYDLAFKEAYEGKFRKKLGVFGNEEGDEDFIKLVLDTMAETRCARGAKRRAASSIASSACGWSPLYPRFSILTH